MTPYEGQDQELLTAQEAAKVLRINPKTLKKWLATGLIRGFRLGRAWRVPRYKITAILKDQEALGFYHRTDKAIVSLTERLETSKKTYTGKRFPKSRTHPQGGTVVEVNGVPLEPYFYNRPYLSLFEWGESAGIGRYDLAISILREYFGPDGLGLSDTLHIRFENEIISKLEHYGWILTDEQITEWLPDRVKPHLKNAEEEEEG